MINQPKTATPLLFKKATVLAMTLLAGCADSTATNETQAVSMTRNEIDGRISRAIDGGSQNDAGKDSEETQGSDVSANVDIADVPSATCAGIEFKDKQVQELCSGNLKDKMNIDPCLEVEGSVDLQEAVKRALDFINEVECQIDSGNVIIEKADVKGFEHVTMIYSKSNPGSWTLNFYDGKENILLLDTFIKSANGKTYGYGRKNISIERDQKNEIVRMMFEGDGDKICNAVSIPFGREIFEVVVGENSSGILFPQMGEDELEKVKAGEAAIFHEKGGSTSLEDIIDNNCSTSMFDKDPKTCDKKGIKTFIKCDDFFEPPSYQQTASKPVSAQEAKKQMGIVADAIKKLKDKLGII